MIKLPPEEQRLRTLEAIHQGGLHMEDVWIHYFSIGGDVDEFQLDGYLHGVISLRTSDRNLISHAVNELISDLPRPVAPYNDEAGSDL